MLEELLKEEALALKSFDDLIMKENILSVAKDDNFSADKDTVLILNDLCERSGKALKECQLIESLDKQLRRLTETSETLKLFMKTNELIDEILRSASGDTLDLDLLVNLVLKWQNIPEKNLIESLCDRSDQVQRFVYERLPELIDEEIERVLRVDWIDDFSKRDLESIKLLNFPTSTSDFDGVESTNPLQSLFASFPLSKLKKLLDIHSQLGHRGRIEKMYPERLLNRFYDILKVENHEHNVHSRPDDKKIGSAPFSVGQIEDLVPEKMKFASRITCILEATTYFITLHPNLSSVLLDKCSQIVRQIRKCAKDERNYGNDGLLLPAILDAQLNEICLIIQTLTHFLTNHPLESLKSEHEKWINLYSKTEQVYLIKGMERAIEMDQIIVSEEDSSCEYPVSSCVDDIFYVLQASKSRNDQILSDRNLICSSFKINFLIVLKKHLESSISSLKPLNLTTITSPFRPARELVSTIVLINNLCATKSNWKQGFSAGSHEDDDVEQDIENLLNFAIRDGIYSKVLQNSVKKELEGQSGDGLLFTKIHSLSVLIINLFKNTLAKEALNDLILLGVSDFSQIFCKQIFELQSINTNSHLILRYDRLLHELNQWLEDSLQIKTFSILCRARQLIYLLLSESKGEAQELVEEWKRDNLCTLRAGEILLLTNKLK